VLNQGKLMDSMSKKLASNDKMLETINNCHTQKIPILGYA
jgi:hypothetical protein